MGSFWHIIITVFSPCTIFFHWINTNTDKLSTKAHLHIFHSLFFTLPVMKIAWLTRVGYWCITDVSRRRKWGSETEKEKKKRERGNTSPHHWGMCCPTAQIWGNMAEKYGVKKDARRDTRSVINYQILLHRLLTFPLPFLVASNPLRVRFSSRHLLIKQREVTFLRPSVPH